MDLSEVMNSKLMSEGNSMLIRGDERLLIDVTCTTDGTHTSAQTTTEGHYMWSRVCGCS